eukprot:8653992-Prorocentrum_lima.AAC.1
MQFLSSPLNPTEDPSLRPSREGERPPQSSRTLCVLEEYGWLDELQEDPGLKMKTLANKVFLLKRWMPSG